MKEPDSNTVWLDRPPWDAVHEILRRHVEAGGGDVVLVRQQLEMRERRSCEELGERVVRRRAFEAEVRSALADADTSPLTVRLVDGALIGRRSGTDRGT